MSAKPLSPPVAPPGKPAEIKEFTPVDVLSSIDVFARDEPVIEPQSKPPTPAPSITPILDDKPEDEDGPSDIKGFKPIDIDEPEPPQAKRKVTEKLREEIEERNASIRRLEQELASERTQPRPDPKELDDLRSEINGLKREKDHQEKLQSAAGLGDHPEVRKIKDGWLEKANDFASSLAYQGRDGQKFASEMPALLQTVASMGDPSAPDFQQKRDALVDSIDEYGSENRSTIIEMLRSGVRVMADAANKQKEIAENSGQYVYQERVTAYGAHLRSFETIADGWGKVDEALIDADPLKPAHIFHKLMKDSPALKDADTHVRKLIRAAFLPPPPLDPGRVAQIGEAAAMEEVQDALKNHNGAKQTVISGLRDGFLALKVVPSLMKRIADLEAQTKTRRREDPKVTLPADKLPDDEPEAAGDVTKFKPTPIKI